MTLKNNGVDSVPSASLWLHEVIPHEDIKDS